MLPREQIRMFRHESEKRSRNRSDNSPLVNILDARVLLLLDEIAELEKKLGR